jgi:hypothetical protein
MAMTLGDLTGISKVTPPLISQMARTPETPAGRGGPRLPLSWIRMRFGQEP